LSRNRRFCCTSALDLPRSARSTGPRGDAGIEFSVILALLAADHLERIHQVREVSHIAFRSTVVPSFCAARRDARLSALTIDTP
jgi:hypothetical protein